MSSTDLNEKFKKYRLNQGEYDRICTQLGRPPQGVEWALFSALWSEHCSYKSSKKHLGKFKLESKRVLKSFGENAGVVDLGEDERIAFKIESHNHPSFIEPYQGAATGVGGILRDIFTMGARPIAVADYLCFGEPKADRMATLLDGVVRGIGGYGNCVGIPNVTGQTEFHPTYNKNILVNAFALGLFRPGEPVCSSGAKGVGNWIVYVGSKTGRDGIHGASMASESFGQDNDKKRPTIQIGDPFFEKLLIEGCIEVIQRDLVVAMQDMGAAGLTSSSFEMASKGGVGFKMHLDQVPLRDSTLTPEDILLSESQERMLLICEPKNFKAIEEVFARWDLDAKKIGEVTTGPEVELFWHNELLTKIHPKYLVDEVPMYDRPHEVRKGTPWHKKFKLQTTQKDITAESFLKQCLTSEWGCDRSFIYDQYDQRVGTKTIRDASEGVGILQLPDTKRGLGIVLGGRPHVCRWDPLWGGLDAILYPSFELAIKGFEPVAATDCLNFGNPERPVVMGDFVAITDGLKQASHTLNCPIISGNVSFYNETDLVNITPTPATGVVGLNSNTDAKTIPGSYFAGENETVIQVILSPGFLTHPLQAMAAGQAAGQAPMAATDWMSMTQKLVAVTRTGRITSSRMVSQLGLGYTLAKMSLREMGVAVEDGQWKEADWLDELFMVPLYQAVMTCKNENADSLLKELNQNGLRANRIGKTVRDQFQIADQIKTTTDQLKTWYKEGWRTHFAQLS